MCKRIQTIGIYYVLLEKISIDSSSHQVLVLLGDGDKITPQSFGLVRKAETTHKARAI
jgi:hypothetical protein